MIARLLALLLLPLALAAAPAARDWRRAVARAPDGAVVLGNPAAKVRLVEYLSYTCPHCAEFSAESVAELKDKWLRSGVVSITFRNAVRDQADLSAALVARCAGPGFSVVTDRIFSTQNSWIAKVDPLVRADLQAGGNPLAALGPAIPVLQNPSSTPAARAAARASFVPFMARLKAYAVAAGFDTAFAAQGITPARFNACYANPTDLLAVLKLTQSSWDRIKSTPSFEVNGALVQGIKWPQLRVLLTAAGAA